MVLHASFSSLLFNQHPLYSYLPLLPRFKHDVIYLLPHYNLEIIFINFPFVLFNSGAAKTTIYHEGKYFDASNVKPFPFKLPVVNS
jgi:membrane associated rhomboid family serine protease